MRSMLYYPYVQPPRDIIAQGVLYWDQMGSIVPAGYELPTHLKQVAERGLYHPLTVEQYVGEVSLTRLVNQVEELLRKLPPQALKLPKDPLSSSTRLYYGKLPYELEYLLREAGLLRDVKTSYQASENLLGPLLALLARAVADGESDPTVGWVCHTNLEKAATLAYEATAADGVPGWRVQMGKIFRIPVLGTPLEEILDFRQRYEDERIELLRAVDKFVAAAGGPEVADLIPQISEEVEYAMKQLDNASRSRGMKLRRAATYGTLAAGAGAAVSMAEALGSIAEASAAGAFGVVGSMLTGATQSFVKREVTSPYNYVHRARAQFDI